MRALKMVYNPTINQSDLDFTKKIERDNWLATVIHTSLMTDRRAVGDELPEGETDPHGYWGDGFENNSYGSLLWTLRREKITEVLLARARAMCLEALNWLLVENYVAAIDVKVTHEAHARLTIIVTATTQAGTLEQQEVFNAA